VAIGKDPNGPGSSANFPESSLNSIGRTQPVPVRLGAVKEEQQII